MKFFLLFLFSFPAFGMYGHTVPNYEKLRVNQICPFSCWAATAEAVYNYLNPEDKKDQWAILSKHPHRMFDGQCLPYSHDNNFLLGNKDYLLDTVLSNQKYKGNFIISPNENDLILIKEKLDKDEPMIISYDFHTRLLYGYFYLNDQLYFQMFNPGAHFDFASPWEVINVSDFIYRKIFYSKVPMAQIMITYLKKK